MFDSCREVSAVVAASEPRDLVDRRAQAPYDSSALSSPTTGGSTQRSLSSAWNALNDLLPDVVLFVAVARARNFSRAAKALQMSISTLSRRILDFEAKLGAQLLLRSTRRVELTALATTLPLTSTATTWLPRISVHAEEPSACPRSRKH